MTDGCCAGCRLGHHWVPFDKGMDGVALYIARIRLGQRPATPGAAE